MHSYVPADPFHVPHIQFPMQRHVHPVFSANTFFQEQLPEIWKLKDRYEQRQRIAQLFEVADAPGICLSSVEADETFRHLLFAHELGLNIEQTKAFYTIMYRVRTAVAAKRSSLPDSFKLFKELLLANSIPSAAGVTVPSATAPSSSPSGAGTGTTPSVPLVPPSPNSFLAASSQSASAYSYLLPLPSSSSAAASSAGSMSLQSVPNAPLSPSASAAVSAGQKSSSSASSSTPTSTATTAAALAAKKKGLEEKGASNLSAVAAMPAGTGGAIGMAAGNNLRSGGTGSSVYGATTQQVPSTRSHLNAFFTVEQCKAIADYASNGVFSHFRLYQTVFDPNFLRRHKVLVHKAAFDTVVPDNLNLFDAIDLDENAKPAQ